MTNRTKLILACLIAMVLIGTTATWGIYRATVWVRDLPNRISIDEDAMSEAIMTAIIQSYHLALDGDDPEIQKQVLQEFSSYAAEDPAARHWIRTEYMGDLRKLMSSEDPEVSDLARNLIDTLAADATGNSQ